MRHAIIDDYSYTFYDISGVSFVKEIPINFVQDLQAILIVISLSTPDMYYSHIRTVFEWVKSFREKKRVPVQFILTREETNGKTDQIESIINEYYSSEAEITYVQTPSDEYFTILRNITLRIIQ